MCLPCYYLVIEYILIIHFLFNLLLLPGVAIHPLLVNQGKWYCHSSGNRRFLLNILLVSMINHGIHFMVC